MLAETAVLERVVGSASRQLRRRRAEYYAFRGAFVGAVAGCIPLLLKEVLGTAAPFVAFAVTCLGAGVGALTGLLWRLPAAEAARLVDRAFGLHDRVATALEWGARSDGPPLVKVLLADATARVEGLDARRVVSRLWPREAKWLALPLVVALVLALAPPVPLPTGVLPHFSPATEAVDADGEQAGKLASEERPRGGKRDPLQRAEIMERDFTLGQSGASKHQRGDLSARFKDTSLGSYLPDFTSFLKKGDDRIRMLEQMDRLPDLQRDFTQSQYKMVFQKMRALSGGLRPDQISPEKLRELLREMERMGRKGGDWGGDTGEGMDALDMGQSDRALEAMERALSKMRALEERSREGKFLRGGREDERRGSRGRDRDGRGAGEFDDDLGTFGGLLPGMGRSLNPKGDPSRRLQATPYDAGVEGEGRAGRREGFDTNLLGRGATVPSRLQYFAVFSRYRKMMEEALAHEQVPREYQTQVKEYFQALEER